ncbi:MFS transporter, PPP family, 3-phenylpropionic acid transporter [Ligilactobacillus sp. WC1T17]|uniref:MFS transporter, PPP family, 3-phenylpropionic acid transporter n=1 Tax=Ligilactobacillus ruminis TaxID=1623 RepID=A0ABY1AB57_9LACO|nr:MFS transporter, PPP family, 3-phenylpropionic acid transporter [Ligilactobacillus ruminis]
MNISAKRLTLQYAFIQGVYWMIYCGLYSFATVYLLSKGLESSQIGIVVALGNVVGFILQPYISSLADKYQNITLHRLIEVLLAVMVLGIVLLLVAPKYFLAILLLYVVADAILQTLQPLLNSLSIYYQEAGIAVDFGIARGFGSLFFAGMSSFLGVLCDKYGADMAMISTIILIAALFLLVWSLPLLKKVKVDVDTKAEVKTNEGLGHFIKQYRAFTMVLLASTLLFTFHNMLNSYLIQVVNNVGGNTTQMGTALTVAAICELPAMFGFSFLATKISSSKLMIFASLAFSVKAVVTYLAPNMGMLYIAMVLQMFAFAVFTPASVYYVNEVIPKRYQYMSQALMVGTTTVSGVIASLLGGFLLQVASVKMMLLIGVIISISGTILMVIFAKHK